MARFRGVHGGLEGFDIAQLADQDDVGVLPHRVLERLVPVPGVQADFTLIDISFLVREHEFDGVLDRENVQGLALIDVIDHGGNSRALARTGDARQDDQPFRVIAQALDAGRQAERGEIRDDIVDAP